jgi:transcriptional regulator with XRE-family HTH domain
MEIGDKLRELRLAKNLSQGDIQKRTGLFRCYTSRVEHELFKDGNREEKRIIGGESEFC